MYLKFLMPPDPPPKRNSEPNFFRCSAITVAATPETRLGPKPLEDAFYAMKTDIFNLEHPSHNTKFNLTRKERVEI